MVDWRRTSVNAFAETEPDSLAAASSLFAPIHAAEREPRKAKQGKGDRDADLVQKVRPRFAPSARSSRGGAWNHLGLTYVSVARALDSVIPITKAAKSGHRERNIRNVVKKRQLYQDGLL